MSDPLTRFTASTATSSLVDSFFGWADRKYSEMIIHEFLDELTSQDTHAQKEQVAEAAFDLATLSYMGYMVEAKNKAAAGDVKHVLKGLYKWRTAEKQPYSKGLDNFLHWVGAASRESFNTVGPLIRTRLYTFLSACRGAIGLDETSYSQLLGHYLLETHSEYQKLQAPAGHPLAGHSVLELVSPPMASQTITYLEYRYKGRYLITSGGKLARRFKSFAEALGYGMPTSAASPDGPVPPAS